MKKILVLAIVLLASSAAFAVCNPSTVYLTSFSLSDASAHVTATPPAGCTTTISNLHLKLMDIPGAQTSGFIEAPGIFLTTNCATGTAKFITLLGFPNTPLAKDEYQMPAGVAITIPAGNSVCVGFGSTQQSLSSSVSATVTYQ